MPYRKIYIIFKKISLKETFLLLKKRKNVRLCLISNKSTKKCLEDF